MVQTRRRPPLAGLWFAQPALQVASGNLASGKETMRMHLDAVLRSFIEGVFRLRADVGLMLRISRMERGRAGRGA